MNWEWLISNGVCWLAGFVVGICANRIRWALKRISSINGL